MNNVTTYCTDSNIVTQLKCTIPMSWFTSDLSMSIGTLIEAKIEAVNTKGISDLSETSTGIVLV